MHILWQVAQAAIAFYLICGVFFGCQVFSVYPKEEIQFKVALFFVVLLLWPVTVEQKG